MCYSDGVVSKMRLWVFLVMVAVVGGKKHRHNQPGEYFFYNSIIVIIPAVL